jgi:hypothetical protein
MGAGSVPSRPMCRRPALCDASATTAEGQPCESWPSVQRSSLCARYPRLSSNRLRRWCAPSPITTSRRTGPLRTSTETGRRSARPESQRPHARFGPGQTEPLRRPCSQSQEAQRIPSVPVREPGAALLRIRYPVPISPSGPDPRSDRVLSCPTRQRSTRCASSTGHRASSRAGCSRNPKSPACPPPRTSSLC